MQHADVRSDKGKEVHRQGYILEELPRMEIYAEES